MAKKQLGAAPSNILDATTKTYVDTGLNGKVSITSGIDNAIQEWWVYPVATYVEAENRTVFGGFADDGKVLVCQIDHSTGEETRVEVATTENVDDHNNPAVHVEAGRRILVGYSNHDRDALLRFKVSDTAGDITSLAGASAQNYDASGVTGGNVTYAQIHKIEALSDASNDVFWVFSRWTTSDWWMLPVTVPQSTGTLSFGTPVRLLDGTDQSYISTAPSYDDDQTIRVAWGFNPSATTHKVFYFEINPSTGAIYSPMDGTTEGNISGTNLPLDETDMTAVLGELGAGDDRRLFYVRPGPALPAIAYADWVDGTGEANATYKIAYATNSSHNVWTSSEYGIAGPKIGHSDSSNYIAGMSFPNPARDGSFAVARQTSGHSTLEYYNKIDNVTSKRVVATSDLNRIARPIFPNNGGPLSVMYSETVSYTDFGDYDSMLKTVTAKQSPAVTVPNDAGTQWGWGQINGTGNTLLSGSVTFPVAFSSLPIVLSTFLGADDNTGSPATLVSQFVTFIGVICDLQIGDITTTGFNIAIRRDSGTWTAGRYYGFTWVARPQ